MCWWGVVGVLCENCIVDASIKHARMDCFCGLFVCVCVISFFFNQFFVKFTCVATHMIFVVCGWFVCSLLRAHGGCLGMLSR